MKCCDVSVVVIIIFGILVILVISISASLLTIITSFTPVCYTFVYHIHNNMRDVRRVVVVVNENTGTLMLPQCDLILSTNVNEAIATR